MDIEQWIRAHEPGIRLGIFVAVFGLVAAWEWLSPQRVLTLPRLQRWSSNIALSVLNTLMLRWLFPLAAVGMAAWAEQRGWGLLRLVEMPYWLAFLVAFLVMDFIIWLQHVVVHAVPLLWRLHRVHHADLDYDLTTGARFHPLEILLSMGVKFAVVAALGPPVLAVLVFEVVLNAAAMFNHGNIRLPAALDRMLRWVIVTPDMHRVHHSIEEDECNANFGFNLSCWDRLFKTYRPEPRAGQQGMVIGLRGHTDAREVARLDGMLLMPLRQEPR